MKARIQLGLLGVLCLLVLLPLPLLAEVSTITATHTYVMGDRDSKDEARALCLAAAKRKVMEKAGSFIQSSTEIDNFHLTKDQIRTYSAAILSVEVLKEEFSYNNGINRLTLRVKADVDIAEIKKGLTRIAAEKPLQVKLQLQQQHIYKLDQQIQALNKKLGITSDTSRNPIRGERVNDLIGIYRERAERGDIGAALELGFIYWSGKGVSQDSSLAAFWFEKAAAKGDDIAQGALGSMYEDGDGVPIDYTKAINWYRKASKQGNPIAQVDLGRMYYFSKGVPQDYSKAFRLYRKAAEQGDEAGQFWLAVMYSRGESVTKDLIQAISWFKKSADSGDARSQNILGLMYEEGDGVPQDFVQAAELYRKAAEQRHEESQYHLGRMFLAGKGLQQNVVKAYQWMSLAVLNGYEDAIKDRENIAKQMTPEQIAAADRLSAEWIQQKSRE